jgi:hypothetical protein
MTMETPSRPALPPGAITIQGTRLRRNWWPPGLGLFALAVGVALLKMPASTLSTTPIYGGFFVWTGGIFALTTLFRNAFPRARPSLVQVSAEGLAIDGEEAIAADAIAESKTLTGVQGLPELVLTLRDGTTRWLRLKPHEVETVRHELGIAAGERRASFPLQQAFKTRWLASLLGLLLLWSLRVALHEGARASSQEFPLIVLFYAVFVATLLAWVVGVLLRGKVVVGADGFTLRWPLYSRFIPFRDVAEIDRVVPWINRYSVDLLVTLRSGRQLRLSARDTPTTHVDRGAEARALQEHLTEALDRFRTSGGVFDIDALVVHGPERPAEWLASLDSLLQGGETRYRVAAPTTERLADIARDASAPSEARIGAAAVLLRRGDDEGRTCVRVATDACADPALRDTLLALEQAEDDAAFAAALQKAHLARR